MNGCANRCAAVPNGHKPIRCWPVPLRLRPTSAFFARCATIGAPSALCRCAVRANRDRRRLNASHCCAILVGVTRTLLCAGQCAGATLRRIGNGAVRPHAARSGSERRTCRQWRSFTLCATRLARCTLRPRVWYVTLPVCGRHLSQYPTQRGLSYIDACVAFARRFIPAAVRFRATCERRDGC